MNREANAIPIAEYMKGGKGVKARGRTTRREVGVMNKTEREYHGILASDPGYATVEYERVTFRLADDTRYTPDFMVIRTSGFIEFHESKGFMEDDAWVKLKVCAEQHPWFTFILAKKRAKKNGGGWEVKTIGA